MGYQGRDCVLRALCESSQIFNIKQKTMVQELIKTVFSFPKSKVLPFEHSEVLIYDDAHRKGRNKIDCETSYSKCGFSLIKMALGKYSKPQNSFM
jgi:DM4/DM12 family